jgi:hypothetical protein
MIIDIEYIHFIIDVISNKNFVGIMKKVLCEMMILAS